jgi:hypothetical protein
MSTTPEAGDLVVVTYCTGSTADRTLTITNAGGTPYTYLSDLYANDTYDANMRVGYRFMPSTPETSLVLSQTFNTADAGRYTIHVFRGVDPSTPIDVTSTTATGIDSRVVNPAAITPSTAGAFIYITGCGAGGTGGTYTASHLTSFLAGTTADTNDAFIGSGFYMGWTSGSYDGANFSGGGTTTTSDSWASTTVALRPATYSSNIYPTTQRAVGRNPTSSSVSLAMPSAYNITSGNHIVIGCTVAWNASGNDCAAGDVTKTAGTSTIGTVTIDQEAEHNDGTNYFSACLWSVPVTGTGTLTLQVSNGSIIGLSCVAQEYAGMHATNRVAGTGSIGTGNSTSASTGSYAGAGHNLFVGQLSFWTSSTYTITPSSAYTMLYEVEDAAQMTGGFSESFTTTSTTQNASFTIGGTVYWGAGLVVYQDTVADEGPTCANFITLMGAGCK